MKIIMNEKMSTNMNTFFYAFYTFFLNTFLFLLGVCYVIS